MISILQKTTVGNVATSPLEAFGLAVSDKTKELIEETLKARDSIE